MEINIKNETLPVCSCVCRVKNNFSAECDVIVPDSKPDILKVLQLSARPKVTSCEIRNTHLIVTGTVTFDILYLADNEEKCVKSITSSCEFSNLVRDTSITDSMTAICDVDVYDLACDIANCRKLSLKATLCLSGAVYSCCNLDIISDIEGACVKKASLHTDMICVNSRDITTVTDSFSLAPDKAPIIEILKADGVLTESSIKVIDDKAIVKGTVRVTVLYTSDNGMEYGGMELAFAHILEADGIREDMNCEHSVKITDISAVASANEEGKLCTFDISTQLAMRVIAREKKNVDCVTDAYVPHGAIDLRYSPVSVDCVERIIKRDADIKERVSLPQSFPAIGTVYQVIARPFIESSVPEGDILRISGYTEIYILYLSGDSSAPACSYKTNAEFSVQCDSPGCMLTPVTSCKMRNISYVISDDKTVELRGNVEVEVQCVKTTDTDIVYEVTPAEYTPVQRPSIIVSCVHTGRTLWDIAKEYGVSPDDILKANALESEAKLHSGAALIIPK